MTRIRRVAHGWELLALGAACLAGCQPLNHVPAAGKLPLLHSGGERAAKVTSAQTADMEIALGRAAEQQGNVKQAIAAYQQALKRDHHRADAYVRLAIIADQQGRFRESAEHYREALKLAPGDPDLYCDMGYSLYLQRRWAEAEMNLRQAIVQKPDHPRAHNNLALLLARNGRTDEALAEFRKGGNDKAHAHGNVAFVLTMEGQWSDARKQYQLALAADPSATEIQAQLRQLDSLAAKLNRPQNPVASVAGAAPRNAVASTAGAVPRAPARDSQLVPTSGRQVTARPAAPSTARSKPSVRLTGVETAPAP